MYAISSLPNVMDIVKSKRGTEGQSRSASLHSHPYICYALLSCVIGRHVAVSCTLGVNAPVMTSMSSVYTARGLPMQELVPNRVRSTRAESPRLEQRGKVLWLLLQVFLIQQAEFLCSPYRLDSILHVQFSKDVADMAFDGINDNHQFVGNFQVGCTACQ